MDTYRDTAPADQVGKCGEFFRFHRLVCRGILFLAAQIFPVLFGGHSIFSSEITVESGYIDETAAECNIRDAPVGITDVPYGMFHAHMVQITAETASKILAEKL